MGSELSGLQLAQADEASAHTETSAGGHGAASSLPPFLQFDPGVWIWTILVFVVLLAILRKMAWKPIITSIEERDKTIKASLDQAARIQEETKRLGEEQNRILAAARSEANSLLQSSRQAADELRRKLEQSAQEEKARIVASAQTEIEASKRAAMADLRRTTAELSIQIAEKLIQANMDDTKQRTLVDKLINEVSAN
jgi:F-type H+-transporting ATPase subunit b